MPATARLVNVEEFERLPKGEGKCELVAGRVVQMSPVGWPHGVVVMRLGGLLDAHLRRRQLGAVAPEVGFVLRVDPDTVRAPDLAFLRREKMPPRDARGYLRCVPDLAIEVLSPDDRPREIARKVAEYLNAGVPLVLVVDPDAESVTAHRPNAPPETFMSSDVLDIGDVVPGFRCAVKDLFE